MRDGAAGGAVRDVGAPGSVLAQDIGMGCLKTSEWLVGVVDDVWCRSVVWSSPLFLPVPASHRWPVTTE